MYVLNCWVLAAPLLPGTLILWSNAQSQFGLPSWQSHWGWFVYSVLISWTLSCCKQHITESFKWSSHHIRILLLLKTSLVWPLGCGCTCMPWSQHLGVLWAYGCGQGEWPGAVLQLHAHQGACSPREESRKKKIVKCVGDWSSSPLSLGSKSWSKLRCGRFLKLATWSLVTSRLLLRNCCTLERDPLGWGHTGGQHLPT